MASTTAVANRANDKPKKEDRRRKVFITSSSPADVNVLRATLDRIGIDSFTLHDVDLPGRNVSEILLECIERADVVIAVLDASPQSRNAFFELGVAHGLKKRTLVLAEADEVLPAVTAFGAPY